MNELNSNAPPKRVLKKRLVILSLVLLAVVGLALWLAGGFRREPLHKGKPISYWVDRACDSGAEYEEEIRTIGAPAVPHLIAKLRTKDNSLRDKLSSLSRLLPDWLRRFAPQFQSSKNLRWRAAWALSWLGPEAKPAVPDLAKLISDPTRATSSMAWALRAIGPEAREAIPALHAALTNQDPRLRVEVAWAIWSVAKETNLVVEICTNAFATSRGDILAAWVLEDLGPVSAGTAPLILQVLRDQSRSERLRSTAALTLGRMGLQTGEIKGALVAGTEDVKPLVRIGCAVALWQLDNKYAPMATLTIIDGLIKLDKSYGEASEDFVQFAENHKLDTKASVPTLTELLKSESPIIRQAASEALKKIGAKQITGAEGR